MSWAQRHEAFVRHALEAFEALDGWYGEHPEATFAEIEQQARQQRRTLMGKALEVVINGRRTGTEEAAPRCPQCEGEMKLHDYRPKTVRGLEGDSVLERAYYVCPQGCGETLLPLDQRLGLRADPWSEGAAQVAAEQGLQAPSFDHAAHTYARAVGGEMSGDSVRRITESFGRGVAAKRQTEVEGVYDLQAGHAPQVAEVDALEGPGNVSTDGVMMLVRAEGGKEVKLTVWSQCAAGEDAEQRVHLSRHSCQAGLWDADTMGRYQYVEGLRRGVGEGERLTSVNDAAAWILRITADNFPQATLIVDWPHAQRRVWQVAQSLFGEATQAARQWAETQVERLWHGRGTEIVAALADLPHNEEARRAGGYFAEHLGQMDYARYRDQGYPIGSGTVESGCKNYVQRRMKRSGRGWQRDTGQAMLSALSELHSGRFDRAWQECA